MRIILCLFTLIVLNGCSGDPPMTPKYKIGEFVRSVLSRQTGQIIKVYCAPKYDVTICKYDVRFYAQQSYTDTHILGNDGAIENKPLALVYMEEFELEKAIPGQ